MNNFKSFGKTVLLGMGVLSVSRLLFWLFNTKSFEGVGLWEFVAGLRFDFLTFSWFYLPVILLTLIPSDHKFLSQLRIIFFMLSSSLCLILNLVDVEFFKVINARTTVSVINSLLQEQNATSQIFDYSVQFWYLWCIAILLLILLYLIYKRFKINFRYSGLVQQATFVSVIIGLFVLAARGGFQYKPINIVTASEMADAKYASLVLNTPFTIIRSYEFKGIEEVNYYPQEEVDRTVNFNIKLGKGRVFEEKTNVVIIILESFGKDYVGFFNDSISYTPFLDSLLAHSLTFENSYANGRTSMDAVPSILAGIPRLTQSPFISSSYSVNQFQSIASVLKTHGYTTSFYHGGKNGTMGFDNFALSNGFDKYVGMDEYPNQNDFDGTWGIFDEPFFQFWKRELDEEKSPFLSVIFSLSSHNPYRIPERYQGKFKKGNEPIQEAVNYSDYALKQFFKTAKKSSWFKNTLFVFTADHTSYASAKKWGNDLSRLKIPIAFYSPKGIIPSLKSPTFFRQIDIYPTILDFLGIEFSGSFYGKPLRLRQDSEMMILKDGQYKIVTSKYFIYFSKESINSIYSTKDEYLTNNLVDQLSTSVIADLEKLIKMEVQKINHSMIYNQMQ